MKQAWIGEYYWTHGPLVLASEAARKSIAASLSEADRKKLVAAGKKREPLTKAKVAGHEVYVLTSDSGAPHTRVQPLGSNAAVLVRRKAYANPRLELPKAMKYDVGWTTEPWRPLKVSLEVPAGGLVMFDAIAQHPEAPQNAHRAKQALPVGVPRGTYVVEHIAEQKFDRRFSVELLFVHPKDHRPELAAKAAPGVPAPLVIDKAVAAAAKKLKFIESEGGPLLFVAERLAKQWWGVCNEAGEPVYDKEPTHYDRACNVKGDVGTVKIGDADALVLATPDSSALHALDGGVLLLRWVGADHAAALLAPALGPGKYKATKHTLTSRGEPWLLFDSAEDGRTVRKSSVGRVVVPKGRYRVEQMVEWNGDVSLGGKTSEVMSTAVRLVRL